MNFKIVHIIFLVVIITISVNAQPVPVDDATGQITYQEVVEEPGNPQELFNRAIEWINSFYSNPVDVTKERDPESGEIKGLHRFKVKNTLDDGTEVDAGTVQYEFTIEFKEGRYRYTLHDFVLRQNSAIPVENWLDEHDPQSKSYLRQVDDFAKDWIKSLKEGMKPKPKKKDDNW